MPRADRARRGLRDKVKICGITRLEDAELAIGLGAWALGFILWPPSKRYVDPAWPPGSPAGCGARSRPSACSSTSRWTRSPRLVDVARPHARAAARRRGTVVLQRGRPAHGREGDQGRADRPRLRPAGLERFHTDYHLLDTASRGPVRRHGQHLGLGRWSQRRAKIPFLLSGRADPENVAEGIAAARPWGVDVAAGVEAVAGRQGPGEAARLFACSRRRPPGPARAGLARAAPADAREAGGERVEHRFGPTAASTCPRR